MPHARAVVGRLKELLLSRSCFVGTVDQAQHDLLSSAESGSKRSLESLAIFAFFIDSAMRRNALPPFYGLFWRSTARDLFTSSVAKSSARLGSSSMNGRPVISACAGGPSERSISVWPMSNPNSRTRPLCRESAPKLRLNSESHWFVSVRSAMLTERPSKCFGSRRNAVDVIRPSSSSHLFFSTARSTIIGHSRCVTNTRRT